MLMLSVIRLMDKLWLESGMDLKMLTFQVHCDGPRTAALSKLFAMCHIEEDPDGPLWVAGAFSNRTITDLAVEAQPVS
ncbi:hypothetical protein HPB48_017833 [Haemaphysalis longicornis]|uniref:Uncharacterized protein n=1 Tax=Haemaphysalis longicornis TaxID=44386 RepID=A0A9J6GAV1_HAELO|nr:hypothetical protein HPB48_017833 [Haemaphysalis longicornis]